MRGFLVIKIISVDKEGFWFQLMKNSGTGFLLLTSFNIRIVL